MEKEFVNYDIALELKELGFDEQCFGLFVSMNNELLIKEMPNQQESEQYFGGILAPTFSQAFRWFREKYKLHQSIEQYYGEKFYFNIKDMVHPRRWDEYPVTKLKAFNESDSQEEAELACLQKLIEIVKNK